MIDRCRNCGQPYDEALHHDWDAICAYCDHLLWLQPGDVAECVVRRLRPFGIIVELGDGVEGLIHISELTEEGIRHPEEVVAVGSPIRALVLMVDVLEKKIGLSCKRLAY